jgi:uncharacterized protein YyaL (SSP411 family)
MLRELRKRWLPTVVLAWGERYESPLWTDRNQNSAYVCKEYSCLKPATSPEEFVETLSIALA